MSETSPVVSFNHPGRPRKAGSIGTPIRDVEVRLLDDTGRDVAPGEVGELAVRGPNLMKGYWNRPEETAATVPRRLAAHATWPAATRTATST